MSGNNLLLYIYILLLYLLLSKVVERMLPADAAECQGKIILNWITRLSMDGGRPLQRTGRCPTGTSSSYQGATEPLTLLSFHTSFRGHVFQEIITVHVFHGTGRYTAHGLSKYLRSLTTLGGSCHLGPLGPSPAALPCRKRHKTACPTSSQPPACIPTKCPRPVPPAAGTSTRPSRGTTSPTTTRCPVPQRASSRTSWTRSSSRCALRGEGPPRLEGAKGEGGVGSRAPVRSALQTQNPSICVVSRTSMLAGFPRSLLTTHNPRSMGFQA